MINKIGNIKLNRIFKSSNINLSNHRIINSNQKNLNSSKHFMKKIFLLNHNNILINRKTSITNNLKIKEFIM